MAKKKAKKASAKIKNVWYSPDAEPYIRVTYLDNTGKRRATMEKLSEPLDEDHIKRRVKAIKDVIARIRAGASPEVPPHNFGELCDAYRKAELIPAVFRNGVKVAGRKSMHSPLAVLPVLKAHFGTRRFDRITYAEIKEFKNARLSAKTKYDQPRAISTVHTELQILRSVFFFAIRSGWLDRQPFHAGKSLINRSQDCVRMVLWTQDEEEAALRLCTGKLLHMRLVITAITNAGFRWGELAQMKWNQINFAEKEIYLRSEQTKTGRARTVAMNQKLNDAFLWWKAVQENRSRYADNNLVLGMKSVKKAWETIRSKEHGIDRPDLQIRDLRTVCATRLLLADPPIPDVVVARLLGNSPEILRRNYAVVSSQDLHKAVDKL